MSDDIPFSDIEPLIQSAEIDGDTLNCVFQCPKSGETATVKLPMKQANKGSVVSSAMDTAQSRFSRSLKRGVMSSLSSMLGNGTVGAVARQAAGQMVDNAAKHRGYTDEEKQRAIVMAFEKSKAFVGDDEGGFVHKKAAKAG